MDRKDFRDLLIRNLLRSDATVRDLGVETTYRRQVWGSLNQHIHNFLEKPDNRWVILPGLRGVGKTTLLAQTYLHPILRTNNQVMRFYLSLEKLSLLGASMNDLVEALQYLRREEPDKLFVICLDEVHCDSQWSLGCKMMFDQLPRSCLICTGSSALSLRLNPDSARRATVIGVPPLLLSEFIAIRQSELGVGQLSTPNSGLANQIRRALFEVDNTSQAYSGIADCSEQISSYYRDVKTKSYQADNQSMEQFIGELTYDYINNYGSLPLGCYTKPQLNLGLSGPRSANNEVFDEIRDRILRTINETVIGDSLRLLTDSADNPRLGFQLQTSTVSLLPKLVRSLANSDRVSLTKIAKDLGNTHPKTLGMMLRVLTLSEIIIEVGPRGESLAKSSKTPKYLFAAPAIRRALVPLAHDKEAMSSGEGSQLRGRLLEDSVAMYIMRIFDSPGSRWVVEYDSRQGGADFILSPDGRNRNSLVVEVGYRKTTSAQVRQTLKHGGKRGLVITTGTEPRVDSANDTIYVPLEYFLLA